MSSSPSTDSLPTVTFDFACIAFVVGFTLFLCLSLLAYFDPDFNYGRTMRESRRIVAQPSMVSKLRFLCCGRKEESDEEGLHEDVEMGDTSSSSLLPSSTPPSSSPSNDSTESPEERCGRCFGLATVNGQACTGTGGRCISQGEENRDDRYPNDHFRPHVAVELPTGPRRDLPTARVVPFGPPVPSSRQHDNQRGNERRDNGERPAMDDHGHAPISPPSPYASYCIPWVEPLGRHFYPPPPRSPSTRTERSPSNPSPVDELRRLSVCVLEAIDQLNEEIDRRWNQVPSRDAERRPEVPVRPSRPLSLMVEPTLAEQLLWSRRRSYRHSILSTTEEVLSTSSSPSTSLSVTPPSSSSSGYRPPVPPRTCSILTRIQQNGATESVTMRQHPYRAQLATRSHVDGISAASRAEAPRVAPRLFAALPSAQGQRRNPPSRFPSQSPGRVAIPPVFLQQASSRNHQPPQVREPEYVEMGVPSLLVRQLSRVRTSRSQLGLVRLHPLARAAAPPPPPPAPTANRRSFFRGQHRSDTSEESEMETFL